MEVQDGRDLHLQFLSKGLFVSDVQQLADAIGYFYLILWVTKNSILLMDVIYERTP